jgi:hypothetical protein
VQQQWNTAVITTATGSKQKDMGERMGKSAANVF